MVQTMSTINTNFTHGPINQQPDVTTTQPHVFGSRTAESLVKVEFKQVEYVVNGILPEGLCIFAGPPKSFKSTMALEIAIAISSGNQAMGSFDCSQGDVLLCSFEDSERRMKDRMVRLSPEFATSPAPSRLFYETAAKRIGEGLIEELDMWLSAHVDAKMIILDTWVHVKPIKGTRANAYDDDALGLKPLHELATRHLGVTIVVIHHTRKAEAENPFDMISGTNGLAGIADTLWVVERGAQGLVLHGV